MSRRRRPSAAIGSGRRGGRRVAGGASRRPRATLDRMGMWEREVTAVNLGGRAPAPLPIFIARATGAHQPYGLRLGCDQEARPDLWIGPWRSTPTNMSMRFGSACAVL